jgi:glycosyltransferase involved in cell wall biosynthesis
VRIAFLLPNYPRAPVGGFRVVYEFANNLVARGHDVSVVHPRRMPNWSSPGNLTPLGRARSFAGIFIDLVARPRVKWQYIDDRVRMVFAPDPSGRNIPDGDAVIATWWATAEAVAGYPASKGRKFHLIQNYEIWDSPRERVDASWTLPIKKLVIAKWLYEKGLELGVRPDEMVHAPVAIDHGRFRIRAEIKARRPRVAMLYSGIPLKGGEDGVKALELAKAACPGLEAVLFGTCQPPRGLPRWIEYVRNPAQDDLVDSIYNGSSMYLCPSHMEGWHLPPAEAMACGCAVVSTDIGGVRDYAEAGVTALLSPAGDPGPLGQNVARLALDDGLRLRIARAGNERIGQFTWGRSTDILTAALSGAGDR